MNNISVNTSHLQPRIDDKQSHDRLSEKRGSHSLRNNTSLLEPMFKTNAQQNHSRIDTAGLQSQFTQLSDLLGKLADTLSKQLDNNTESKGANAGENDNNDIVNDNVAQSSISLNIPLTPSSNLLPRDADNIRERLVSIYGVSPSDLTNFSIHDVDTNLELSAGDVIDIPLGPNSGMSIQLTREDILVINSDPIGSREDFLDNKQKWLDNQPSSYTFTLDRTIGGSIGSAPENQPVDISYQSYAAGGGGGGHIVGASFSDSGLTGSIPESNKHSIDDLFDIIEAALNESSALPVTVQYNAQFGYPESIYIDYIPAGADDELDYVISDFFEGDGPLSSGGTINV